MYGNILGGATAVTGAAVVLPSTGSNKTMAIIATITLVVGVTILVSSFARIVAKKAFKS